MTHHDIMGTSPDGGPALPRADAPDDARVRVYAALLDQWADADIYHSDGDGGYWCAVCGAEFYNGEGTHAPDCAWVRTPQALAADDDQIAALAAEMDGGES